MMNESWLAQIVNPTLLTCSIHAGLAKIGSLHSPKLWKHTKVATTSCLLQTWKQLKLHSWIRTSYAARLANPGLAQVRRLVRDISWTGKPNTDCAVELKSSFRAGKWTARPVLATWVKARALGQRLISLNILSSLIFRRKIKHCQNLQMVKMFGLFYQNTTNYIIKNICQLLEFHSCHNFALYLFGSSNPPFIPAIYSFTYLQ